MPETEFFKFDYRHDYHYDGDIVDKDQPLTQVIVTWIEPEDNGLEYGHLQTLRGHLSPDSTEVIQARLLLIHSAEIFRKEQKWTE